MQQASSGTREVSQNISGVPEAAFSKGAAAAEQVLAGRQSSLARARNASGEQSIPAD